MLAPLRLLLLAASFAAVVYGEDITIPLDDGSILIQGARFIRESLAGGGTLVPELSFTVVNQTSSPWNVLKLQFDMGGVCNGEPRQWSRSVVMVVGWMEGHHVTKEHKETIIPLTDRVNGCRTEIIKASLLLAENSKVRIDGVAGERIDLQEQLREIEQKREAEAAARAEEQRIAAEAQAKRDAADAVQRKRLAAEQKKRDAEAQARYAKIKAEEGAKAAAERAKVRAACALIYKSTVDKKISDLTVREEQQVRACQALGLYPPQ